MHTATTPAAAAPTSGRPRFTEAVTRIGTKYVLSDGEDLVALIGGIVSAVLLVLVCVVAVMMWCLSRQKGSYDTNETEDDYDDLNNEDEDEAFGSNIALQTKEPLKPKEDE